MDWESFTPWSALAGGALIGAAASLLLAMNGRIAGISGVLGGVLKPVAGDLGWRLAFLAGLVLGGVLLGALEPAVFGPSPRTWPLVIVAGALVGIGTRLANGCTSGHGVCGLSRLSKRSLVATVTFIATGAVAAAAIRVIGGQP